LPHIRASMLQPLSRFSLPPLLILAALAAYRLVGGFVSPPEPDRIAPPDNLPAIIHPTYDEPRLCTDRQLAEVLDRVKPPASPPNTNNMVHALRLWGPRANFGDVKIPSGPQMLAYFLDDAVFQEWAGQDTPALFFVGADGIQPRIFDDGGIFRPTSSFHPDDLLATLAETGTPLDAPLRLRGNEAQVADLLSGSMQRFYPDRLEYEWSIISYVRYLYPLKQWRNKYGEKITVGTLVKELLDKTPEAGPCDGLHRLEALVLLYRVEQAAEGAGQKTNLPKSDRRKMLDYMKRTSELLVAAQSADGYWTRQWSRGTPPGPEDKKVTLHDKLLVTGHHLEWLALAPEEVQPPRENIVRAGQWLTRTLLEIDQNELTDTYGPYSHAARALCLWRSVEPFEAWRNGSKFKVQSSRLTNIKP
jgi:hypothetical protein